jgi:diguanylate cyclase (GGDEF)-like protein
VALMSEMRFSPQTDRKFALMRRAQRIHAAVCATYVYEVLLLVGFCAGGYIPARVVVAYAVGAAAFNCGVYLALRAGWSLRLPDSSLFLAQEFGAALLTLGLALAAPQIAIQPIGTWIALCFFGFLAPNRRFFVIAASASLICAAIAIFSQGAYFAMPTATPAGQALTWAVMLGILGRGIGVANFIAGLRNRLGEKNEALREALGRIEILAQRDELTGLANRRSIMQWLAEQLALSERTGQPVTIALLDIDHFKRINDDFGHLTGDRVLEKFSQCGLAAIRATDRLGRYGGEEFLVVLVATSLQGAEEPLERIRAEISACDWSHIDRNLPVTVTIGAATHRRGESLEDLMRRADVALYRGKQGGRDRVVLEDRPLDGSRQNVHSAAAT